MPDNAAHKQIVYRLLPGTPENACKLADQIGACQFVWNELAERRMEANERAKEAREKPHSVSFFLLGTGIAPSRRDVECLNGHFSTITRYAFNLRSDARITIFRSGGFRKLKPRRGTPRLLAFSVNVNVGGDWLRILKIRRKGGNPYPDGNPVNAVVRKAARDGLLRDRGTGSFRLSGRRWHRNKCQADHSCMRRRDCGYHESADASALDAKALRSHRKIVNKRKWYRRWMGTSLRLQPMQGKPENRHRNLRRRASRKTAHKESAAMIEILNAKETTRSAKWAVEKPGGSIEAKSGPGRENSKTGWRGPWQFLAYDCGAPVEVNSAYASLNCYAVGHADSANRTDRKFKRAAFARADHASLNAARLIMASGLGVAARRGAFASATPAAREKTDLAA